jgi:catechol 2,3-dioxygenase-like lactoylglutathione lyase family enzyme
LPGRAADRRGALEQQASKQQERSAMGRPFNTPPPVYDPARGLLHSDHFQIGYVTNDLDRAAQIFRDKFGIAKFRENDADLPGGTKVGTRTVWIGSTMYEIVCGSGPGMEAFSSYAPPDGPYVLKFHHFGYLVQDDAAWQAMEREVARQGWELMKSSDTPGYVRACFVDVPELGHLVEFILPREGLIERFNATPLA